MKRVLLMMLVLFSALAMSQELGQAQAGSRASPLSAAPVSATVTPPASQCVQDANLNGVGDVADIEATAAEMDCHVYLPLVAAQWRQPWPTPTPTPTPPPILVSIVMHNEEPPGYPDFVNDEPAFWQHRNALVQFADMLHANGVMFNYQSDWNFLQAVAKYDTGTPETNGKNVVRYIKEDLGFEVDPHAHESLFNYADVAYLIEALGVEPSHTVGGMIVDPPEDSILEQFWQPITGRRYPTYTWQAEITWGGGTRLHVDEESLWASGVWKPRDKDHFLEHADAAPLPNVGNYGGSWENLDRLLQLQQNGELEDKIHTCTIFARQDSLLTPGFIQQFEQRIQARDAAGDIRWVGLAQVIEIWQTEYNSEPNILPFLTPTPTPDYHEPAINVIFNVHMEPFRPDPLPLRQQEYEARRQELELPLEWAETYGIELTVKAGGEFVEFCLDSGKCGENPPSGLFADLRDQGVEVGTHWHTQYQRGSHDWPDVPEPDETTARRIVTDNRSMVDRVIGAENNKAAGGIASYPNMHADQDFTMAPGLGETGESQFGHVVWNPWRPGEGAGFPEDLSNDQYVAIPHLPQIGLTGGGGQHVTDLTLPHAQRSFLTIFLEWREHERSGDPDKVWDWGVAYQLNIRTDATHNQNPAFFQWLNDNFIGQTTPRGTTIARYATVRDVYDEFLAWEAANPGVSSFHWEPGDPYPYSMPALVEKLDGAAYEDAITTWEAQGISVHRLSRDGAPVYVLYSDAGQQQIDFSSELAGQVRVTDGQGNTQVANASSLTVTEAPMFVEPTETQVSLGTPHGVVRLPNGNTLITDGGVRGGQGEGEYWQRAEVEKGIREQGNKDLLPPVSFSTFPLFSFSPSLAPCPNCSRIIEVDEAGEVVWSFGQGLVWAHDADRLLNGNTLIADTNKDRIIEVNTAGEIVWSSDDITLSDGTHLRYPNDVDPLPGGRPSTSRRGELVEPSGQRLLITDRDNQRIIEIDRAGNILWQLGVTGEAGDGDTHLNWPHNADRLPSGHTILADSGNDRIIEVDSSGSLVWEYRPTGADRLLFPKDADRLPNNNVLITDSHNSRVVEVASDGTVVWEYSTDLGRPYDADRLANGNTLISGTADGRVIEVDPSGNIVWQYPPADTPTPTADEPPINVTFNIHFDPVLSDYDTWRERKDNLLWLKSFVEGYSGEYQPKLNLQVQGDHAEF